jgi:ATP-binding cassette subfamily B protein
MAGSFAALAEVWGDLQRALGASERLGELLGGQGEENNRALLTDSGVAFKIKNIKFVDVDFAYPAFPEKKVLNQVSFTLDEGSMNALVGPSGAGKSTVFLVLLGFYKSLRGQITFSDRDISTLPVNFIRESVSVVSQNPTIFSASALDNIRYGKLEASDEEVILAAKAANAHGFISELQEGYQSFLGQKGVRLSGGQRQRIAIARALLKNSSILLLDEATSSLDSKSEVEVQKGLEQLLPGRTSLVIAHRLATVRRADKIIVMDKGKIVESGKHEFLIKNNGLYSKLASFQFEI